MLTGGEPEMTHKRKSSDPATTAATKYAGAERRESDTPDRRRVRRGGRRATDVMTKVATFVYSLLTERSQ
jgi:hypothetical protein